MQNPLIDLDKIEWRDYQINLAKKALEKNCMIVLPTGLGKTVISLIVASSCLSKFDNGKALILSPTKPLVEQHSRFFKNSLKLDEDFIITLTGEIPPKKRVERWDNGRIIVSTPQVIENDLISKRINLRDVVHITFDEAHRAVGLYSYVYIAKRYIEEGSFVNILGITASPGSNVENIEEICKNLFIDEIVIKGENDPDILPYTHKRSIQWIRLDLSDEIKDIKKLLDDLIYERMDDLKSLGLINSHYKDLTKKEIISLQKSVRSSLLNNPSNDLFFAVSILAEILKVKHAVELIETQGISTFNRYLDRLMVEGRSKGGSKAAKRIILDPRFNKVLELSKNINKENKKIIEIKKILSDRFNSTPDSRVIIFANYRDTVDIIVKSIEELENVKPVKFVGQAKKENDKGLTQKEQVKILEGFRNGDYNVLVATSVAEEGLDIPATDLVIFYEPVPSEIRSIQRKGRTARRRYGEVIFLITKNTQDEVYYWISMNKEKKMRNIGTLNNKQDYNDHRRQKKVLEYFKDDERIKVIVDHRELRSNVAKALENKGVSIDVKTLEVGDYIVSDRTCLERKTTHDLLDSLFSKNRGFFEQLINLKSSYDRPVLLIEGSDLYTIRNVSPNAIRGLLSSIVLDFNIPILMSTDYNDSAELIYSMAEREQKKEKRTPVVHSGKTKKTLKERQEYIVSSLPNIGLSTAKSLLSHFGSIRSIFNADKEELMDVENIGEKTAKEIRYIIDKEYQSSSSE
ncbi:MAG: DEAD/DEAH box helicase [Candidatus Methanoliparum thermophilum]|uniref:DEAD/DEAH box helicase n=1 Tax=Methanoliparum thermophilum TaxID=2491083 RepID=A0A520KT38_METT2|nr:MAG: DEAD/DEAH box helicase [Candidatus Methanoliparum thermophilum]